MGSRLRAAAAATRLFVICAVTPLAEALHMNPVAMLYQSKQLMLLLRAYHIGDKNGSYERP